MSRFVVLQHDAPSGLHWDFMLQAKGVLKTWSLECPPDDPACTAARALPDHRVHYLDYEGEVSGGRGHVVRWDQGTYETIARSDEAWEVRLTGAKLAGRALLVRPSAANAPPDAWQFTWRADAGSIAGPDQDD